MKMIMCQIGVLFGVMILAQIILGFGIPFSMHFIGDHMPMDGDPIEFAFYIYGCPQMLWLTAGIAAIPGAFILDNVPLRRAILSMPIWAPLTYTIGYIVLVWQ